MRQATIFYFSGTGNTRLCALELGAALARKGLETKALSIEGLAAAPGRAAELVAESDVLALAYPVYGSDLPGPMEEFLRALPPGEQDCAVLCTQWLFSGDGAAVADEVLAASGRRARWTAHVPMPNNVAISAIRIPYTNDPVRLGRARERARVRAEALAEAIARGGRAERGRGPLSRPLGLLQRGPYRRYRDAWRDAVASVDGRCTACGLCVRLCPVGNLVLDGGRVRGLGRCAFCLRCYDFCPESAMAFLGKAHDLRRGPPYRGPEPGFSPMVLRSEERSFTAASGIELPRPRGPR